MINKKNKIHLLKTTNFFREYPIILLLQHNNLKVSEWSNLRLHLKQMNNVNLLIGKNSVIEKALLPLFKNQNLKYLFQGPSSFIGCQEISQLKDICNFSKSIPNIIFIGGIMTSSKSENFRNQFLNHLDLEKLVQLDNSIYVNLLNVLNSKNNIYDLLQKSLDLNYFLNIQTSFVSCLNTYPEFKNLEISSNK